jgi:hypothetical protein
VHHVQALALRRVALTGSGLGVTLVAHAVAVGGLHLYAYAPFVWATILLASLMCGSRGRFAPRGCMLTFGALGAVQVTAHVVMLLTPWLLGLAAHHHGGALIDPRAIAVHAIGAIILTALLLGADRLLAGAVAVVRLLAGHSTDTAAAPCGERLAPEQRIVPRQKPRRAHHARGPPARPAVVAI